MTNQYKCITLDTNTAARLGIAPGDTVVVAALAPCVLTAVTETGPREARVWLLENGSYLVGPHPDPRIQALVSGPPVTHGAPVEVEVERLRTLADHLEAAARRCITDASE